jgi:hypothetical protein
MTERDDFHQADIVPGFNALDQIHVHRAPKSFFEENLAVSGGALAPGFCLQFFNLGKHGAGAK